MEKIILKNCRMIKTSVSGNVYIELTKIDHKHIGTSSYSGIAYFWNSAYKHLLRDAVPFNRRRVHARFINECLKVDGKSNQHKRIITEVLKVE